MSVPSESHDPAHVDLAVVRGRCSSTPEVRVLRSGSTIAVLQVTARPGGEPAASVPVACWDPPGWVAGLGSGDEVLVVGRVRRRFFRSGGRTASRVEVEADTVVPVTDRRRVAAALRRARARLDTP